MANKIQTTVELHFKEDSESLNRIQKKIQDLGGKPINTKIQAQAQKTIASSRKRMSAANARGDEVGYNKEMLNILQAQKQMLVNTSVKDAKVVENYNKLIEKLTEAESKLLEAQTIIAKKQAILDKTSGKSRTDNMISAMKLKSEVRSTDAVTKHIGSASGIKENLLYLNKDDPIKNRIDTMLDQVQEWTKGSVSGGLFQNQETKNEFKQGLSGTDSEQLNQAVEKLVQTMSQFAESQYKIAFEADKEKMYAAGEKAAKAKENLDTFEEKLNSELPTAAQSNLSEINNNVNKILGQLPTATTNQGQEQAALDIDKTKETAAAESKPFKQSEKQAKGFGAKLAKAFSFGVIIRGMKRLAKEAVETVKQIDEALTTQAMVSGRTREQTYKLLGSYQDLAKQCGATSTEVAQVATAYLRQGRTAQEALAMTETAVKAAKVAGISTSESVDYLTTAVNGFGLAAEDAMEVSDKFAALASQAAVSYDELAVALSKVASQANLAGMSMDYTLALLTKGIETTRESAESIGTALKTILARMREVSDYGETLDGSLSLNNVEQQLSYVGISLRDTNGELRSTETVLNELGTKWDGLSANQQAAIAKALAGTRQQSRLIAMMQDYERTTELVTISQRSLGATEAQMATYMQGMEAAINNVKTSYEGMITAITNSEFIIGIVNGFGNAISFVSENTQVLTGFIITLTALLGIYGAVLAASTVAEQINTVSTMLTSKAILVKTGATKAEIDAQRKLAQVEGNVVVVGNISNTLKVLGATLSFIKARGLKKEAKAAWQAAAAQWGLNTAMAANPIGAIIILIVALVAAMALLVIGIIALVNWFKSMKDSVEKCDKRIQDLSNSIYDLEKTSQSIDTLVAKFESLDNKILKSAEDLKQLQDYLSKMRDLLNEDQQKVFDALGQNEQIEYMKQFSASSNNLANALREQRIAVAQYGATLNNGQLTDAGKAALQDSYLNSLQDTISTADYDETSQQVLNTFAAQLSSSANANTLSSQAKIQGSKDFNKKEIKDLSKKLGISKDEAKKVLSGESKLANQDQMQILNNWLEEKGYGQNTFNTDWISDLTAAQIKNISTLQEGSTDYKSAIAALNSLLEDTNGIPEANEALKQQYSQLLELNSVFGDVVDQIDKYGFSIDDLQSMNEALKDFGDDANTMMKHIISADTPQAMADAISNTVSAAIERGILDADDTEAIAAYRNKLTNILSSGLSDDAQKVTAAKNSVSNIYSNLSKKMKGELTREEEAAFMAENSDLFADNNFYNAWQTGDWNAIEEALGATEYFKNLQSTTLQSLNKGLAAAIAQDNQSMIDYYNKAIEEMNNSLTTMSLNSIKEIQDAQISAYKDTMQQEHDELVDSLNKRKDAYNKYFDAVKQEGEDADYYEQRDQIVENMSKIGAGTDANSQKALMDMETKLQDLEKERLDTLRERAQEAVIQNIDDQISDADEYLSQMTKSTEAILELLRNRDNNSIVAQTALTSFKNGDDAATWLSNIESSATIFGTDPTTALANMFTTVGKDNIKLEKDSNGGIILNVNGQTMNLSAVQNQTLYNSIISILSKMGISA